MEPEVVRDLSPDRAGELVALYRTYDGWADRTREDVRRALEHTDETVALEMDELVAAARIHTDYVYYARVYDVVVERDRRGEGLGRRLLEAVVEHPALSDVEVFSLNCQAELVGFYEQFGFERIDDRLVEMTRIDG